LINKENNMPYYVQIYNELKTRIDSMVYKSNEILPSENELAGEFNVTRVTVRNAIKKLKDEGRIHTEKGIGSYVNSPKIVQNLDGIYTFGKGFDGKGYRLESKVIETYKEACNSSIQKNLKLGNNESVIVLKRVRSLEGIPVVIQTSYIPESIVPKIEISDLNEGFIYDVLEKKYGIKILKATEYLDPIVADEYYSELLQIELNTPLFMTERITYSDYDKPVEFRKCVIRNDKFRFLVELE
jgi:GntR family transcriptional regulator